LPIRQINLLLNIGIERSMTQVVDDTTTVAHPVTTCRSSRNGRCTADPLLVCVRPARAASCSSTIATSG
jgi:hypothetical protein